MPVYAYNCEHCDLNFEKYFSSISLADPYIDAYECEKCGKAAIRLFESPPVCRMIAAGGKPLYSSPGNPDKQ